MSSSDSSSSLQDHTFAEDGNVSDGEKISSVKNTAAAVAEVSEEPIAKPSPPAITFPDGGFTAWMQCLGSFVLFVNSWGLINSFGAFQEFYQTVYIPDEGPSNIAWIGSVQAFLIVLACVICGPLSDRGYCRSLIAVGSLLVVFGMMMASIATSYWQLLLAQGVVVGLGEGCLFIPSVAIPPAYFLKKRAMVMGIAASGSSIGGIIFAIIFHRLQPSLGFGWAMRVIAFLILGLQVIPLLGMKQRFKPARVRSLWDASVLRDPAFFAYSASILFGYAALYIPFFFIQPFAFEVGIATGSLNFYLIAILNAGSFFGRVIPNILADKIGTYATLLPCTILATVICFAWPSVSGTAQLVFFCVFYGFFSGSYVSLNSAIVPALWPDITKLGTRMGMLAIPMAVGVLVGTPAAGGAQKGSGWIGLQMLSGAVAGAACIALLGVGVARFGWKFSGPKI